MDMDIDTEHNNEKIGCESMTETINDDNDADINVSKDENKINSQADDECIVEEECGSGGDGETTIEESTILDANHSAASNNNLQINLDEKIDDDNINYDDQDIEKSLAEMERCSADDEKCENIDATVIDEKNAPISIPMEKRKFSESKWTSDDEGFAGFDDSIGKCFSFILFLLIFLTILKIFQ